MRLIVTVAAFTDFAAAVVFGGPVQLITGAVAVVAVLIMLAKTGPPWDRCEHGGHVIWSKSGYTECRYHGSNIGYMRGDPYRDPWR